MLVIHHMFYSGKKDFPGQTDEGTNATAFLKKHPFDLVVSGDNHRFLQATYGDQRLINLGSLMRSKIDQANHKPRVCVFDTETRTPRFFKLDVKPFAEIFDMSKEEEEKERSESLQNFIEQVTKSKKSRKLNFLSRLKDMRDKVDEKVAHIIDETLKRAELKWKT